MKQITAKQYAKIHPFLPVQRGNVRISNIVFISALLSVPENGCKLCALPERFGKWYTVYARFRRWSRSGVLKWLFAMLRPRQHQHQGASRRHRGAKDEWAAKHRQIARRMVREDPYGLRKRPTGRHFSPVRRECPRRARGLRSASWDDPVSKAPLAMDRACEGDETRQLVRDLGTTPVVPPKANQKADRETCKFRNEIERLFQRFKSRRRIFTRFDKLDATSLGLVSLAAVVEPDRNFRNIATLLG